MTPVLSGLMREWMERTPGLTYRERSRATGITPSTWSDLKNGMDLGDKEFPGDVEKVAKLRALLEGVSDSRTGKADHSPPRTINEYRLGLIGDARSPDAAGRERGGVSAVSPAAEFPRRAASAPGPPGATVPGVSAIRGESSLREIAIQCRDFVTSGLMSEADLVARYRVDAHNAALIVSFIRAGMVDGERASEGEIPAYTANAEPEHAVVPWTGNILVIGDCHIPFTHKEYLDFCQRVRDKHQCERVIHIGDEADNHALSYHESDPDGYSAGHEAEVTMRELRRWYAAFPDTSVMLSNHGSLPFRKAYSHGIPRRMMRTYREVWEAPAGWVWYQSMDVEGEAMVHFTHGTGYSGRNAALSLALAKRKSTVIGHIHTAGGVQYQANEQSMVFGLNVGCGVEINSYAAAYGRSYKDKPTLGCGIILDGGRTGLFVPMV